MASSINIVAISGNLTRDPELRMTPGGTQVLNFGVAVNDRAKNQQTGEWEDRPNFIDCVLFGNRADALSRILRKGIKVSVSGSLRWSQWERDGQKRSKVEVVADEVVLMQAQQDGHQQPAYPQPAYQQPAYPPQAYAPQPAYQQPAPQAYQQPQPAPQAPRAPQPQPAYQQPAPQQVQQPQPVQPAPQAPVVDVYDEEIPF